MRNWSVFLKCPPESCLLHPPQHHSCWCLFSAHPTVPSQLIKGCSGLEVYSCAQYDFTRHKALGSTLSIKQSSQEAPQASFHAVRLASLKLDLGARSMQPSPPAAWMPSSFQLLPGPITCPIYPPLGLTNFSGLFAVFTAFPDLVTTRPPKETS